MLCDMATFAKDLFPKMSEDDSRFVSHTRKVYIFSCCSKKALLITHFTNVRERIPFSKQLLKFTREPRHRHIFHAQKSPTRDEMICRLIMDSKSFLCTHNNKQRKKGPLMNSVKLFWKRAGSCGLCINTMQDVSLNKKALEKWQKNCEGHQKKFLSGIEKQLCSLTDKWQKIITTF